MSDQQFRVRTEDEMRAARHPGGCYGSCQATDWQGSCCVGPCKCACIRVKGHRGQCLCLWHYKPTPVPYYVGGPWDGIRYFEVET